MTEFSAAELYHRGVATLVASWEAYAHGAPGAAMQHAPGVVCAVFPHEPERSVYNNALLECDLAPAARGCPRYNEIGVYARWDRALCRLGA
jgi:hypothetical protein